MPAFALPPAETSDLVGEADESNRTCSTEAFCRLDRLLARVELCNLLYGVELLVLS
jgi:hypothetical protein